MKSNLLPILFLLSSSVVAQEPDSSSALFNMREAERNFAKASVMFGRNAAFIENFADESVIFTDKWLTNGKEFWKKLKTSPVVLKWEPEFMDISASRDFGVSTGPSEAQEYRPNTVPLYTGYFLSVWEKKSDGAWKVILDAGSPTPAPTSGKHTFSFPAGADKPVLNPPVKKTGLLSKELLDREEQILKEWQLNPSASTYTTFLSPNSRIKFNGHLPASDSDTINMLLDQIKSLIWKSSGAGASTSGDLGYTYGLLVPPGTPMPAKGHYVRIWKKQQGTDWKIFIEMISLD